MRRVLLAIIAASSAAACAHRTTAIGEQTKAVPAASPQGGPGDMTDEPAASLQDEALRALLMDAHVAPHRGGDDGPGEFFRADGRYWRDGGRGAILAQGRFEIRDGAVCLTGDGLAPSCRRVRPNGDGTYTFIDTADGSAAVMTVTRRR